MKLQHDERKYRALKKELNIKVNVICCIDLVFPFMNET